MLDSTITAMALVSSDARRTISEATVTKADGSVERTTIIVTKPEAAPVGNYFHDGRETFVLVAGSAELLTQDVATDTIYRRLVLAPDLIEIQAGVAHTFVPNGPITLVCLTHSTYEDLGTHP
jgi:mannose-6-phosphate isomerase-like protein (cupin superfamily)